MLAQHILTILFVACLLLICNINSNPLNNNNNNNFNRKNFNEKFEASLLYEWVTLEYEWGSSMGGSRQEFIDTGRFIPENCALAGIKQYQNTIYVTVCH